MKVSAFSLLLVITTVSWLLLLLIVYFVFVLIIPIQPPLRPSYVVAIEYVILKLILILIAVIAWLYSYFALRNAFASYKNLRKAPTSSS